MPHASNVAIAIQNPVQESGEAIWLDCIFLAPTAESRQPIHFKEKAIKS